MDTKIEYEKLSGAVERVTFHNSESGFCVLRVKVKGQRDLMTVVGNAASIAPGEYIQCQGVWINDKNHGLQFKAQQLKAVPPTTLTGIEKYLGSGMIRGIGPFFAKKLVRAFGEAVFDVIEQTPERLLELAGIGKKRKDQVTAAWAEQKIIRNIMVFLQSHGVGTARAVRIYKTYGDKAIEKVKENPYRLALDIRGIGFKTADHLAERLGITKNSLVRAQAGMHHVLQEICNHGHCAAEHTQLVRKSVELLDIEKPIVEQALQQEIDAGMLIKEEINERPCVFPTSLYHAEKAAAEHLQRIQNGNLPWGNIDSHTAIPWVENKTGLTLAASQRQAIDAVLHNKMSIITGGPGVGKTTIVNSILKILRAKKLSITLCAPTGRAAKRLSETTRITAKTIHRLLEFDPQTFAFKHNRENPLNLDVLVLDEASMIDAVLFYHLLKAIPDHAAMIFVGDIDQLPSVGSGAVLADLIQSHHVATVKLVEIFRQAAGSNIIINAHRINQGAMPLPNASRNSDFYTIYTDTVETIHEKLLDLVSTRLPNYFNFDPIADIQVLTPMNRGGLGSRGLNFDLQQRLNGNAEPKITRYGYTYAPGDKVIQNVNNYDKEVFNGDIGTITHIDIENSIVTIQFDSRAIEYDFNELDEISLAYAISIHKSQGSEFPAIVLPIATQHYMLLARNLLYTGVTRGKKLVVLLGQKKAVAMAIRNNQVTQRLTKLAEYLQRNSNNI